MNKKVFYIMGRGHSGSTVLDSLLGDNPDVRGVGEFIMGADGRFPCSCGEYLNECNFWSRVKNRFEKRTKREWLYSVNKIKKISDIKKVPIILLGWLNKSEIEDINNINDSIWESIFEIGGEEIIVDSSKEVSRALCLAKYRSDVNFIHLVRDPVQVMASEMSSLNSSHGHYIYGKTFKSKYMKLPVFLISVLNWLLMNCICEVVKKYTDKVVLVRYEDLNSDYQKVIKNLGNIMEVDMSRTIQNIDEKRKISIDHKLAGNEMAKSGGFVFNSGNQRKYDVNKWVKYSISILTYPLSKKYGYYKYHFG